MQGSDAITGAAKPRAGLLDYAPLIGLRGKGGVVDYKIAHQLMLVEIRWKSCSEQEEYNKRLE